MTTYRWCGSCGAERPFERPPCVDAHGADCPEEACVLCGAAIMVGALLAEPAGAGTVAGGTASAA